MNNIIEKYPEGHFTSKWMGIGIAIGTGIGVPFGLIMRNPAFFGIGIPVGLAIGLAIGSSIEAKYKKEDKIRPLTEDEKKKKKLGIKLGIGLLFAGFLIFLILMLK